MKKILIILVLFLSPQNIFSQDIYERIDVRLDSMQESIVAQNNDPKQVIKTLGEIIGKSTRYEKKYPAHREIFEYVKIDFQNFLEEYKQSNGYINTLSFADEIGKISNLEVFQREFLFDGKTYLTLRKFKQNGIEKYLVLEDKTYKTSVISASQVRDYSQYSTLYENSEYKSYQDELYNKIPSTTSPLQNNGITHAHDSQEVFLTADFCPSSKHGFEKGLLEQYIKEGHKNIGIAITSAWIDGHADDYAWLLNKNNLGELNIAWINHTKTHNYSYGTHFSQNFILTPGLSLDDEFLDVENKLLQQGQVPSVFMRYPGLVSDDVTRKTTIYDFGLIPLGSDAWLAKGEHPNAGSIILIHGNKNEHYGVELMQQILEIDEFEYGEIENILE